MPDFILKLLQLLGLEPRKGLKKKVPVIQPPQIPPESSTLVPVTEVERNPDPDDDDSTTWEGDPPVVRMTFSRPQESPVFDFDLDKRRIIWSILSVFETGKPEGDYTTTTVLQDGAGITYGKHQAIDRSGTLDAIVMRYIDLGGGIHGTALSSFLPRLASNDTTKLDPTNKLTWPLWATDLIALLQTAGSDPVMQRAQDQVFEELYWNPCFNQCVAMKLIYPLSWCAIYDTCVQSGPSGVANIRKRFPESPPSGGGDEKVWAKAYLTARRKWLAEFHNPDHPERDATVRSTIYRMDALLALVAAGNWNLTTPIQISKPKATIT